MLREFHLPSLLTGPELTGRHPSPPRLFPCSLRFTCDLPGLVCLLFRQACVLCPCPSLCRGGVSAYRVTADTRARGDSDWEAGPCFRLLQAGLLCIAAAKRPCSSRRRPSAPQPFRLSPPSLESSLDLPPHPLAPLAARSLPL